MSNQETENEALIGGSESNAGLGLCIGSSMSFYLFLQMISGRKVIIAGLNIFWPVENLHTERALVVGVVQ